MRKCVWARLNSSPLLSVVVTDCVLSWPHRISHQLLSGCGGRCNTATILDADNVRACQLADEELAQQVPRAGAVAHAFKACSRVHARVRQESGRTPWVPSPPSHIIDAVVNDDQ